MPPPYGEFNRYGPPAEIVGLFTFHIYLLYLLCFYKYLLISLRLEMGEFMHACEGDLVCKATNDKVPFTNAFIFNEQKAQIGKVDEVLGPMTEVVCFHS